MLSEMLGLAARSAELASQAPGVREAAELARQVPGVRETEQALRSLERRAIREVREALDHLDGGAPGAVIEGRGRWRLDAGGLTGSGPTSGPTASGVSAAGRAASRGMSRWAASEPAAGWPEPAAPAAEARPWAARMLAELLDRSVGQTRAEARRALHERVLRQLVPDEARILAALSDGSAYPVIDVVLRSPVGAIRRRLVDNVSSVGREAGVALPGQAHWYVTHLRDLGLIEFGPEDPSLADRYELLGAEEVVRRAQDSHRGRGAAVKVLRGVLRLSGLGWELWRECDPPG